MQINGLEIVKCIIIFILLYNFESVVCSLTGLITESINYLVACIALKLAEKQQEMEDHSEDELTPCIGFQVPSIEEDSYD